MSEWHSGDVVANGIRIHYTRTGNGEPTTGAGKPALVLCHGLTDRGLCWTLLARELEADYDVIMPDARGHGLSEVPRDGNYGTDPQADDVAGLVRALGVGPVVVGGHSMGGATALYLAALYPDLVRAAFLEDPALFEGIDIEGAEKAAEEWRQSDIAEKALTSQQRLERCRAENPTWADEELAIWADCRPYVAVDFHSMMTSAPALPWQQALAGLKCPVLLLAPERGITTPESIEKMRGLQPALQVASIPGTGHCIRRDSPAAYLHAVRGFLASLSR